ncbi:MAG: DUF3017 domain-containing protein [Nocardioidaceae bacterium]|nr:DUF3017 domain-containing protein [Nocardioidaceae bacterium]
MTTPGDRPPVPTGTFVYAALVVLMLVGLALVAVGPWRFGVGLAGWGFVVAGLARLVVRDADAGLLRVRRKRFDIAWMVGLGAVLVVLAVVVPPAV